VSGLLVPAVVSVSVRGDQQGANQVGPAMAAPLLPCCGRRPAMCRRRNLLRCRFWRPRSPLSRKYRTARPLAVSPMCGCSVVASSRAARAGCKASKRHASADPRYRVTCRQESTW